MNIYAFVHSQEAADRSLKLFTPPVDQDAFKALFQRCKFQLFSGAPFDRFAQRQKKLLAECVVVKDVENGLIAKHLQLIPFFDDAKPGQVSMSRPHDELWTGTAMRSGRIRWTRLTVYGDGFEIVIDSSVVSGGVLRLPVSMREVIYIDLIKAANVIFDLDLEAVRNAIMVASK